MSERKKRFLTNVELSGLVDDTAKEIAKSFDEKDLIPLQPGKFGIPPGLVRTYLTERGVDYSFRVLANINLKGGVGKTTSAVSIAARASQYGFKTCVLDLDSQGSASLAFDKLPDDDDPIFIDIWQKPGEEAMDAVREIEDGLHIIPSSLDNGLLDVNLMNPVSQKNAVNGVCNVLEDNGFDLAVIDCPPSLGAAVISTICAADTILIPVCNDRFSFKGLELTMGEISSICETFNLEEPEMRILYTKYDKRIGITKEAHGRLKENYGEYLLPVTIGTSSEFSKSLEKKETIFSSGRKNAAKEAYDRCARYLLEFKS